MAGPGSIRDRGISWLRKRYFYLPIAQNGWLITAGVPTSLGAGARAFTQRTGLNMTGLLFVAAADAYEFDAPLPYDIDISRDIGVRVHWTSNAAAVGARTITWQVFYNIVQLSAAFTTPTGAGSQGASGVGQVQAATALDTVILAEAPAGVNNAIQISNRGLIAGATLRSLATAGANAYYASWRIVMSAFNAAFVENKYLIGLEIDYNVRKTFGPGRLVYTNPLLQPFLLSNAPNA